MNYKKGTQTRSCMKSVMRYVSQLSKTLWDGQPLVSGIGCQPETAFDEFLSTKLLHHKDGGVMFYHMVQSFPKGANIDPRTAHEAARRLAGYFDGCEVLVCTHVDREHIHSHCIINSVNFETGRKVHMADEQIQELRIRNDQICEELGLPKFQKDEQRHSRGMSNAEYYTADRGESWKFELMRVIDECMRYAGNRDEFLTLLRSEGYDAAWTDSRKNITYTTPEGRKCRDSKLHMEKYLKENMEAEFGYRTENDNTRNVGAAQKADGRGATAGTQRDGHGAELECAARNAGQAVPAADAVGRTYRQVHLSPNDDTYIRVGTAVFSCSKQSATMVHVDGVNHKASLDASGNIIPRNGRSKTEWQGEYSCQDGRLCGVYEAYRRDNGAFGGKSVTAGHRRGVQEFAISDGSEAFMDGTFQDAVGRNNINIACKSGEIYFFESEELMNRFLKRECPELFCTLPAEG